MKKIFSKPRSFLLVTVILFLPLLFLGTHTSHDWGDDFAQYIHQAENIVHHVPQSETGYIYNQLNYIGPQAYPIGFPLLLAPVYALAGNRIAAFTYFISIIYVLLGMLMVIFYRKYFSWITAIVLALIFLYNPQMIIFKREVMSDIPFTAFLVLNFILYLKTRQGNRKQIIILVLTTGFMLAIRPAGIVFVAAIAMDQFLLFLKKKSHTKDFGVRTVLYVIVPFLIYFIFNSIIFKIPSGGSIRDYMLFYFSGDFIRVIPENMAHHIEVFRYMYIPQAGVFEGFSILLGSVMLTMTFIGFLKRMLKGPEVIEWFFIFYMLMLLIFPNNYSAFRLMFPLGFIMLFYAANGLQSIQMFPNINPQKIALVSGAVIMLLFIPGIISIVRAGENILEGPQKPASMEAFNYIKKNVPFEAVVVFAKPRALALYTGCCSMVDPFTTDPTFFHKQVIDGKASHLLINSKITGEPMQRYSRVMQDRLTRQWENKEFVLYKINPVIP